MIRKKGTIWPMLFVLIIFLSRIVCSEEKEKFKPRFSIKLTGGWRYVSIGDVNSHLESFNNSYDFEYARLNNPESISGEITQLNNHIYDWEAELRMDISSKFALGISTSGAIRKRNESSLTYVEKFYGIEEFYDGGEWTSIFTFRPEVKAQVPVKLSIYYRLPFVFKTNIIFYSGIGYYSANVSKYEKLDLSIDSEYSYWRWEHWKTDHKTNLGLHGGIGIEYNLSKNLALVAEAYGRYARIRNLIGTLQKENSDSVGRIYESQATLWYFKWACYGKGYYRLDISEESPSRWGIILECSISNVRKARIDLSGFSVRMGIRIKLF